MSKSRNINLDWQRYLAGDLTEEEEKEFEQAIEHEIDERKEREIDNINSLYGTVEGGEK